MLFQCDCEGPSYIGSTIACILNSGDIIHKLVTTISWVGDVEKILPNTMVYGPTKEHCIKPIQSISVVLKPYGGRRQLLKIYLKDYKGSL